MDDLSFMFAKAIDYIIKKAYGNQKLIINERIFLNRKFKIAVMVIFLISFFACALPIKEHSKITINGSSIYLGLTNEQVEERLGTPGRVELEKWEDHNMMFPENKWLPTTIWHYGIYSISFEERVVVKIIENLPEGQS